MSIVPPMAWMGIKRNLESISKKIEVSEKMRKRRKRKKEKDKKKKRSKKKIERKRGEKAPRFVRGKAKFSL